MKISVTNPLYLVFWIFLLKDIGSLILYVYVLYKLLSLFCKLFFEDLVLWKFLICYCHEVFKFVEESELEFSVESLEVNVALVEVEIFPYVYFMMIQQTYVLIESLTKYIERNIHSLCYSIWRLNQNLQLHYRAWVVVQK